MPIEKAPLADTARPTLEKNAQKGIIPDDRQPPRYVSEISYGIARFLFTNSFTKPRHAAVSPRHGCYERWRLISLDLTLEPARILSSFRIH